jgi:hypothetical protein
LIALLLCGACDCEEKIRRTMSNPGDRVKVDAGASKPSGPSETEPNDKQTTASPIAIGNELRPITGEVGLPDDVDWFALRAKGEPGSFAVSVEPDTGLDVSLHVEVPDGAPLSYDQGRRGDAEQIPVFKIGTTPQRFAIRSESNSTGPYTIRLERHMGSGLEAEPNDETNVATELRVPGEIQGYYDRPDDRDVYRLSGSADTPYVVEIAPVEGVRQIARVFQDARLKVPRLTLQVSDKAVRVPNLALSEEAVRWLVFTPLTKGDPERPYRIRVSEHPPIEGTLELEPNDEEGMAVETLPATFAGYLHSTDDRDRYRLVAADLVDEPVEDSDSAPEDGESGGEDADPLGAYRDKPAGKGASVSALLEWSNEGDDLGLQWSSDGTEDPVEFRRSSKRPQVRACGLTLAGTGLLEVRSAALEDAPTVGEPTYRLSLRSHAEEGGWEVEPNDSRPDADVLESGAARGGALAASDDVDTWVFAVEAEELQTRSVSISVAAEGVDLIMRVLDDGGGMVANVDNAPVGRGETQRLDLPEGVYFVELRWKGGEVCAPYQLEMSQ